MLFPPTPAEAVLAALRGAPIHLGRPALARITGLPGAELDEALAGLAAAGKIRVAYGLWWPV